VGWKIKYTEIAAKQMKKLDKAVSKKIDKYLNERIATLSDPSALGKPLGHDKSGLWRYRLENYRIICEIQEDQVVVLVLRIGHRKEVYHYK
jgi:mRNA interferase RelE/StbE